MPIEAIAAVDMPRPSWRIKKVAAVLDCDLSQVSRMVKNRQLEAHKVGKRGVRVYVDSVRAYQAARPAGGSVVPLPTPKQQSRQAQAVQREACAFLKSLNLM